MSDSNKAAYDRLLSGLMSYVEEHEHDDVQRFKAGVANWGSDWSGATPSDLPATRYLEQTLGSPDTHPLVTLFNEERTHLKWEQSYTKSDGLVGDDMLAGYGFAEVIGKRGPFVSTRVRSGIGVWGPDIDYPLHRHAAEEVYIVLAGSARFQLGKDAGAGPAMRRAGDVVYVPSMLTHGFHTADEPLVVFYIWQAGDLREKSTFS